MFAAICLFHDNSSVYMSVSELHSQSNPAIQSDWQYAHALLFLLFLFPLPLPLFPLASSFLYLFLWYLLICPVISSFPPVCLILFSNHPQIFTAATASDSINRIFELLTTNQTFHFSKNSLPFAIFICIYRLWECGMKRARSFFLPYRFFLYIFFTVPPIDSLTPHLSVCLWCLWCLCFPSLNSFATRSC